MNYNVRVLLGPPRWTWAVWTVLTGQFLWMVWLGPSVGRVFSAIGVLMIGLAWERHLRRRALWLTEEEVVISNSGETHIVPKAGASAAVIEEQVMPYLYRSKPEWDNSVTATRRLYVVPADPNRKKIQVEAAQGLTPRRLRAVVDELEIAFKEAS